MIHLTTFDGTEEALLQYIGDEYCIIYEKLENTLGYWLVEIMNVEGCMAHNALKAPKPHYRLPVAIANIPEFIMNSFIDMGFVVPDIPDKEWSVQTALGTAPVYRIYLIKGEIE